MKKMLEELGHKQQAIPVKTVNTSTEKFIDKQIKLRLIKHMYMHYRLQVKQQQAYNCIYWQPGPEKNTNYISKHLCQIIHQRA